MIITLCQADLIGQYEKDDHADINNACVNLQRTADLIRKHGMEEQVTITSFQQMRLEEIRAYALELPAEAGWFSR